jgi:hypothetical protein
VRRLAIAVLFCSSRAFADDAADIAAARELATEGVMLADAGKCDKAIDKLARADKLHHAPTILERLGECQVIVGRLVEGTENLQRVIREPLGPNPPAPFVAAVARAQKVLSEAQPKIAKLTIFIEPEAAAVTVTVDGTGISSASIGTPRPMDPGAHVIEARASGYRSAMTTVTLTTSQIASITLKLEPKEEAVEEPVPPPAKKDAPPPKPLPPPEAPPPKPNRTAAYLTLGIGVAGLAAGATFGFLAMGRKNALNDECDASKVCPPSSQTTLDAAQRWAAFSSVGFAVGAAGVTVGTILLLTTPSDKKGAWVAPTVGIGSLGLRGEF